MFDKKCSHDEAKVELKKYIDNAIHDKMSWYDDELTRLRFRLSEIEKEKTGRVNFKYLEKNLTVTEAIARLKDGRALVNEHLSDDNFWNGMGLGNLYKEMPKSDSKEKIADEKIADMMNMAINMALNNKNLQKHLFF